MRVTSAKVVGVMPSRSPEERQHPLGIAEFLSSNAIAALRSGDPSEHEEFAVILRQAARILLDGKNPATDLRKSARFLADFDVLAARMALSSNGISAALADVQADLEGAAQRLAAIGAAEAAEIRLLSAALRRSSGILRLAPDQLPEQMLFRLRGQGGPLLRRLLRGAAGYKAVSWLRPLTSPAESWQEIIGYLHGHASAACFDPNDLLLVVDQQRWLECRDLSGGKQPQLFRIGKGEPTGLACDGAFAAIPTREGPIRVIELASGPRDPLVPAGTGATLAVTFVRPGCLASGGTDGRVRLWDVTSGTEIGHFDIDSLGVEALAPLGGDKLIVGTDPAEGTQHAMQIWNLQTWQREAIFASHDWPVTAIDIPAGADLLLAVANDELSAWHLPDLSCAWRIHCQDVTFHSLASVSGQVLAADSGGSLRLLGLRDGTEIRRLSPHSGLVPAMAVDAARQRFVTVSYDQSIRLWDAAVLERPGPPGHQQEVSALALTASGHRLLSGSKDGRVLSWDARTGAFGSEVGYHEHWVSAIAALPGDRAISAGWDGTIRVWDLSRAQCMTVIRTGDDHLTCLACAPDASRAVSVSTDGAMRVWDLVTGAERAMITVPDSRVVAVAIDGDRVRWITESGRLSSWHTRSTPVCGDVQAASRVTACDLGAPGDSAIVGLADGQLVTVRADGTARIFDGAGCGPTAIARDAVGELVLATYGVPLIASDNTARLWAGPNYSSAGVLVGDLPWTAAAVAADGRYLYLGDESGAVHIVEPVLPALSHPGPTPDDQ
jgi:WD40 repeat protein